MSSAGTSSPPDRSNEPPRLLLPILGVVTVMVLLGILFGVTGKRNQDLPTDYGRRRGGGAAASSVNGTAALAELFRKAGHRVSTMRRLSPRAEEFDIIVWVPDNFENPTKEQRQFLEDWLASGTGRTVVYVGRDYDAAIAYWRAMLPSFPKNQSDEALLRQAEARAAHEADRSQMPEDEYARWFVARRDGKPRQVKALTGPWAAGIDPAKTEIELEGRLAIPTAADRTTSDPELPDSFEPLLASDGEALATLVQDELEWGDGQIIVLANGSFVLNYPLVNREHRKLAAKLVSECGTPGRALFIESDEDGPPVLEKEPRQWRSLLELPPPLDLIVMQLVLLGVIFCLARSPIFGRPKELPADSPADFGKHVAALGELLARTQDRTYAEQRLSQYHQLGKRQSGRSHLKPAK
jgi:hypothetical protein